MKVVLIISGGIAAVKSWEVLRLLVSKGHQVKVVLTKGGSRFVTAVSIEALSGHKAFEDLFTDNMSHIHLTREADIVIVAPASASLISRYANGYADDLASTLLLASAAPVLLAPSMNKVMWSNISVRRNIEFLSNNGVHIIGPEKGDLACGEFGEGRLSEASKIVSMAEEIFSFNKGKDVSSKRVFKHLRGKKFLVTSGSTRERIDAVRYISNLSSGLQGISIANMLSSEGAETTLVLGPADISGTDISGSDISGNIRSNISVIDVETADGMHDACMSLLPVDVAICVAAVCDFRPRNGFSDKKFEKDEIKSLDLELNKDILFSLSHSSLRPHLVIGFSASSGDIHNKGLEKLKSKGCDWIIANNVSGEDSVIGKPWNKVSVIDKEGIEDWPLLSKQEVARRIVFRIGEYFSNVKAE